MELSPPLSLSPGVTPRGPRRAVLARLVILAAIIAVLAVVVIAFEQANRGRIYPGVRIAGVDVGRTSTKQAAERLATHERLLAASTVVLAADGHRWSVRAADLGAHYDVGAQVGAAYGVGRHGTVLDRLTTQARLIVTPLNLTPLVRYDQTQVLALVATLARDMDRPARNALVALRQGAVILVHPAAAGQKLDQEATAHRLASALVEPHSQTVTLPLIRLEPKITTGSALTHALQMTLALGTARRAQARLLALAPLMTRREITTMAHLVNRTLHLEALATQRRARIARLDSLLVARVAAFPVLRAGGQTYMVPPALAQAMLRVTVTGAIPRLTMNPAGMSRYVAMLAARVARAPRAANLTLRHGRLVLLPSSRGLVLDQRAAFQALATALEAPRSGVLALPTYEIHPAVETAALRPALVRGRWLLEHPPTLVAGKTQWTPAAGALEPTLMLGGASGGLALAPAGLRHVAAWLAHAVEHAPQDATFGVDGQKAWVIPSADGTALDTRGLVRSLMTLTPGTRRVAVPLLRVAPHLTTTRAHALGINTMVGMSYTNFYGSTGNRITNILAAVRALDGSLIAPGEVFSFNKAVGTIDYAHGYVDGISIIDGKDVPGVGGGVCQVAVTIFKAAIYAGLPIVERHPHANVVSYYQPVGMDATIYDSPDGPDVKFKNDTGHWLVMRFAYNMDTAYLEARFYSTNIDQHADIYGPYYSYYANGNTSAIFFRKVYRHGKKIHDDSFFSEYVPAKQ